MPPLLRGSLGRHLLPLVLFALLGAGCARSLRASVPGTIAGAIVRNRGAVPVVVAFGTPARPTEIECHLVVRGERVSRRGLTVHTRTLAPGESILIDTWAGDGTCGVLGLAIAGRVEVLAWRRGDAFEPFEEIATIIVDASGLISPGGAFYVVTGRR